MCHAPVAHLAQLRSLDAETVSLRQLGRYHSAYRRCSDKWIARADAVFHHNQKRRYRYAVTLSSDVFDGPFSSEYSMIELCCPWLPTSEART